MDDKTRHLFYVLFGMMVIMALLIIWRMTINPIDYAAAQAIQVQSLASLKDTVLSACAGLIGLIAPIAFAMYLYLKHEQM